MWSGHSYAKAFAPQKMSKKAELVMDVSKEEQKFCNANQKVCMVNNPALAKIDVAPKWVRELKYYYDLPSAPVGCVTLNRRVS